MAAEPSPPPLPPPSSSTLGDGSAVESARAWVPRVPLGATVRRHSAHYGVRPNLARCSMSSQVAAANEAFARLSHSTPLVRGGGGSEAAPCDAAARLALHESAGWRDELFAAQCLLMDGWSGGSAEDAACAALASLAAADAPLPGGVCAERTRASASAVLAAAKVLSENWGEAHRYLRGEGPGPDMQLALSAQHTGR